MIRLRPRADSRYQSTKGIPAELRRTRHGVLLGTDFRHAVEFSKSGRAETRPFRASLLAGCPTLRRFPAPPAGDVVRRPSRAARRMENSTRASGPSAGGSRPTPAGHRTTRSEAVTP